MAKNLIGSEWLNASDGAIIKITNPATNEFIDSVPESTKKTVMLLFKLLKKDKNYG